MALQLQGPMAQDHLKTTGTQDADLILSRTQMMKMLEVPSYFSFHACEQIHAGVSTWLDKFFATTNIPASNRPIRIHCKTCSLSARFVFETRAKCKYFVARYKDDGLPYEVDSLFATPVPPYWCANPSHQRTEKLGDGLRHLGKFWPQSYKKFSLAGMPKVISLSLPLMYDHKSLSIYDRRNGVGKPVFKLAPVGHEQLFDITAPDFCEPRISDAVLRQIVSEANNPAQNRPFASSPFGRLAEA